MKVWLKASRSFGLALILLAGLLVPGWGQGGLAVATSQNDPTKAAPPVGVDPLSPAASGPQKVDSPISSASTKPTPAQVGWNVIETDAQHSKAYFPEKDWVEESANEKENSAASDEESASSEAAAEPPSAPVNPKYTVEPIQPASQAKSKYPRLVTVPAPDQTGLARYHREKVGVAGYALAVLFVFLAIFQFTGISRRLQEFWEDRFLGEWNAILAYIAMLLGLIQLLLFFFVARLDYFLPQTYTGQTGSFLAWFITDYLLFLVSSSVTGFAGLVLVYLILRQFERRWWLILLTLSLALALFVGTIYPLQLQPYFQTATPLAAGSLRTGILDFAGKYQLRLGEIYEMTPASDGPAAFVRLAGLKNPIDIWLSRPLVEHFDVDEIGFLLSREVKIWRGHYPWWRFLARALSLIAAFLLAAALTRKVSHWPRPFLGFSRIGEVASLPFLILLALLAGLAIQPLDHVISRSMEQNADSFALLAIEQPKTALTAYEKLLSLNALELNPSPWWQAYFSGEPAMQDRLDLAEKLAQTQP
jgi:Zn-dependent protease with chaperone function